ncbi:carbohydrate-binding module family 20 domain-containing protein [Kitasatospora sp. NBC_01539]|uniref:carbohydrate-binding module family 20 domain-containing protein n=1 Tax=Kitasatospora sp. NBC_01539 TaxID=2903577 RepID=UPI00386026F7
MRTVRRLRAAALLALLPVLALAPSAGAADARTVPATFEVEAPAQYGQNLYLTGSVPELGGWEPVHAVALDSTDALHWRVTLPLPAGTRFTYKYQLRDPNGGLVWSPGADRTLATGSERPMIVHDTWEPVEVAFTEQRPTLWGQRVYVVGDLPALGGWRPDAALPLSADDHPAWRTVVPLPAGTAFAYKYLVEDEQGTVLWESGPNRSHTTGASGTEQLADTWR